MNRIARIPAKAHLVRPRVLGTCAAIGLLAAFGPAYAATLLDFTGSGSLSSWTTYGTVATTNATRTLTFGPTKFSLTPAAGQYMASIEATGGAVTKSNIDATLGLTSGTMNAILSPLSGGNQSTNYGVLTKTMSMAAGTYTFYWSYAAQDYYPYNDGVLFSLSGNGVNSVDILASNGPDGAQAGTVVVGSYGATQWAAQSFTIAADGTYQLGFASYNWIDEDVDPILFIGASAGTVTSPSLATPIDTNTGYYLASKLGSTVNADFKGGTLRIDASGTFASNFSVEAYSGNTIDAYGNAATFSGTLSGAGGLIFTDSLGGGNITLSGSNGYLGATTISGVTVTAGAANTLPGTTNVVLANTAGTVLNLAGFNQAINSLSGGGTTGGNVTLGGATLSISNGGTFGGVISGSGSVVLNGGTLILNGQNTYTGSTTVTNATLIVGDATHTTASISSSVTAGTGSAVGGYGTIKGNLTVSGGVVSPGSSIGTLTVTGAYTQSANSTLAIEVAPNQNDKLVVGGNATLNGTLNVTVAPGTYTANVYTLMTAAAINGSFATVNYTGTTSDMVYGIYYAPGAVDLAITPQTAGEVYGDVVTASLDTAAALNRTTLDHLETVDGKGLNVWANALGGASRTTGSVTTAEFDTALWGMIGGADYLFDDGSKLSGVFGYARSELGVSGKDTKAATNGYYFSLAAHMPIKAFTVDVSGFAMDNIVGVTRDTGATGNAKGKANNFIGGGSLQVGYPLGDVLPFARLTVASLHADSFDETDAGALALSVDKTSRTSVRGTWGVAVSHNFITDNGTLLVPRFTLGLEKEFGQNGRDLGMNLAGSAFVAPAPSPSDLSALLGAELSAKLSQSLELNINANGRLSSNQREGILNLSARYTF